MVVNPGHPLEMVRLDLTFHNETFQITDPMTRELANTACRLFAEQATPVEGKRVVRALIVPEE